MKLKKLSFLLMLASGGMAMAQRSQTPWNYKEELFKSIDFSELPAASDQNIPERSKKQLDREQNGLNRVTVGCQDVFLNGTNIAWINYGRDIGINPEDGTPYHPNLNEFDRVFEDVANAGGNSVRWWLHTNGSTSPSFNANNIVSGIPSYFTDDLIDVLDLAASHNIKVQICLFSFDMLKDKQSWVNIEANKLLLTNYNAIQAYIDNALLPMVEACEGHPGLLAWEIFNEPEGMTLQFGSGWSDFLDRVTIEDIQKFINLTAGAIHRADPEVIVTSSAWAVISGADQGSGNTNYYTDARLIAAGGDEDGTLDIYNLHYYDWAGTERSPFHNTFEYWGWDKPTVIAEYHPEETFGVANADLGTTLYNTGYAGSWTWSVSDIPSTEELLAAVEAAANIAPSNELVFEEQSCTGARFAVNEANPCLGAEVLFEDRSNDVNTWSWDFGPNATPSTYNGQTPPPVTFNTEGTQTITLIADGNDATKYNYSLEINVIDATSAYNLIISSDDVANCTSLDNASVSALVTPELSSGSSTATGSPGITNWGDPAQDTTFQIMSDGTIANIAAAQTYLVSGTWHTFSSNYVEFVGTFGENASIDINVIGVDVEEGNYMPSMTVYSDDVELASFDLETTQVVSVNLPVGTHVIKVQNTADSWIQIGSYSFAGLGLEERYRWYVNGNFQEETISGSFMAELSNEDVVTAEVYTAESSLKCLTDWVMSNEMEVACLPTSTNASKSAIQIHPNPTSGVLVLTDRVEENTVKVFNLQGVQVLQYNNVQSIDIGELAEGIYYIAYTSGNNTTTATVVKQ